MVQEGGFEPPTTRVSDGSTAALLLLAGTPPRIRTPSIRVGAGVLSQEERRALVADATGRTRTLAVPVRSRTDHSWNGGVVPRPGVEPGGCRFGDGDPSASGERVGSGGGSRTRQGSAYETD